MSNINSTPLDTQQSLCTQCGLCCNGTIFDFVPIETHEKSTCQKYRIPFKTNKDDTVSVDQPCPAFDKCCTIYEERFDTCRDFECKLLLKTSNKEVSEPEALQIIELTKNRYHELQLLFDKTTKTKKSALLSERYKELMLEDSNSLEFRKKHGLLIAKFHSLNLFIEKNFGYADAYSRRTKL